jgi:hypothetical protein
LRLPAYSGYATTLISLPTACPMAFTAGDGEWLDPLLLATVVCDPFELKVARLVSFCADCKCADDA